MTFPAIRAGDFRHLVTLQKPTAAQSVDSVGDRVTTWVDVASVYASIDPISGNEKIVAAQRQATTTHTVTVYYDSAIAAVDASWRVKYGTRIFTIDAPPLNPEERNRTLELSCTEGTRQE